MTTLRQITVVRLAPRIRTVRHYTGPRGADGAGGGGGLDNVVEDLTPALGGTLDGQGNDVDDVVIKNSTINISNLEGLGTGLLAAFAVNMGNPGALQAWSAVLDATTASFTLTDESKLDGIEAGADVTDAANVTAAGALMDSECADVAALKAATGAIYTAGTIARHATAVFDGGGSVLTVGAQVRVTVPVAGTIQKVRMLADVSGSAVVDIWKDTYANFPPLDADSITAAAPPTISAATKSEDETLTGWTTAIAAGDVLIFNLDSVATITHLTVELEILV